LVGYSAGGGVDTMARIVAQRLGTALGQSVIVENRGGAASMIAADVVAKAPADGYTLLVGAAGTIAVAAHLGAKLPFDPMKDFEYITTIGVTPNVLVVNPSIPANNIREMVALARASGGKLNYGTSGTGGAPQLAAELFKSMTGAAMTHVPYKGLAPALTDLIGGQIQVVFADVGLVKGQIAAGKLKGLAVTGATRSSAMPELPTIAEAGVPGYAAGTWYSLLAPAGTPREAVQRLSAALRQVLETPEIRDRMVAQGADPAYLDAEAFARFLTAEMPKWAKVVKESGAKID